MRQTDSIREMTTEQIEALNDEYRARGERLYVRWSMGPRYDTRPSRDYVSGGAHAGLSAVELGNWGGEYLARRLAEYKFLRINDERRRAYIYAGETVGLDSDGYELIDLATAVCIGAWTE